MKPPARKKPTDMLAVLRRALAPAAAFTIIASVGAYAVLGPNGVLAYVDYQRQVAKKEREYAVVAARREVLKNRVALLDPRRANPDLVDELVRKELNVAHPDEVIVPLDR